MNFNENWNYYTLDELGYVGRGKSRHRPRNEPSLYGGPYPFIQTADIRASDLYITQFTQTYSELGLAQSKIWNKNTLCITNAGENTGECAILNFKACFPDSIIAFIADADKADVRFIKYYLDTIKPQIKSITKGATQDNLSIDKLLSFKLRIPRLPTQRKIAAILSAYDDMIENNLRRIKFLEEMAQNLYREWFVNFRFYDHEKAKMIDSPLGKIPEGWDIESIRDIVTIKSGFPFQSKSFETNGSYGIVTIKNVQDGTFDDECKSRINDIPKNFPDYCSLFDGDILISLTGNIGRVCLVFGNNLLLNQRVGKVVPKDPKIQTYIYDV
jgi:type I restriction enzyme, S subunit